VTCMAIQGGIVLAPSGELTACTLLLEGDRIVGLEPESAALPAGAEVISVPGCVVAPGFVDTHSHGGMGWNFMSGTPEAVAAISDHMARGGVTACLATTTSAPLFDLQRAIANAAGFSRKPPAGQVEILGVHLEGPFINPKFRGVHMERYVREPQLSEMEALVDAAGGALKVVTLAPEIPGGMVATRFFTARGVQVSIGHSGASYDCARAALAAGVRRGTHVFNALPALHHREPGPVLALLEDAGAFVELVVDGHHVHPGIIAMAVRLAGPDRILAITDCTDVAGLGDGLHTRWEGTQVTLEAGVARTQSGVLAGSTLSMNQAVANLVRLVRIPLASALRMAAENPVRALGLQHRKGSFLPGRDADVVVLREDLSVLLTIARGQVLYDGRVPGEDCNGTRG
jgi:N-acetylglucosamine-6-phosphate deacetylase